MKKTKAQLEAEILIREELESHRKESDEKYAMKLVERVLWSLLATAFIALVAYFIKEILT